MIKINLKIDSHNIIRELVIIGHSGFANKGNDPLCAGLSTLAYSLLFSLKNIPNIDYIFDDSGIKDGKDDFLIKLLSYDNMVSSEIRGITIFFVCGVKILSDNFKKYITFSIEEVK